MGPRMVRRAAAAAALGLVAAIALGAPGFAYSSRAGHSVVIPPLRKASTTATCPKGQHVGFGGVVAPVGKPYGTGSLVFATAMRRTASNKLTVTGQSLTAKSSSRLTAVAYCARGASAPRVVSKSAPLPGLVVRTVVATCPVGTIAVGGGYSSAASLDHAEAVFQLEQGPDPRQWVVSLGNVMKTATKMTAYAYCAAGAAPVVVEKSIAVKPHKGGTAHASCPAGKSLLFGGLLATSPGPTADLPAFSWSASSSRQWDVAGFNVGDQAGDLTAIAYCR